MRLLELAWLLAKTFMNEMELVNEYNQLIHLVANKQRVI